MTTKFKLDDDWIQQYANKTPPFGFNGLGELVYMRTYSRVKDTDGVNEKWWETIRRVVEGCYNIQKEHIDKLTLGWNDQQAQRSAQEMYDRMYNMKFLPPGRGLWAMGTKIITERNLGASLNNCAFVSTAGIGKEDRISKPFTFLMDMCMLGVGVGFDTKGEGNFIVQKPDIEEKLVVIEDTREGWVESLREIIEAYYGGYNPMFDYSKIRPEGVPLKTFGGLSSGSRPLQDLHRDIRTVLENNVGEPITVTSIVDIMNLIGKCVVAGNVRRTAEIAFGEYDSQEFMDLKNYEVNPQRSDWGWTSNNSIFAHLGMNYDEVAKRICINGEPGLAWLENMKDFSRMNGVPDYKDARVCGGNPCLEQSLESYELCCLVETFPARCDDLQDYLRTLKFAYLYAKTVTLCLTHWPETNRVQLRNRRIGCSMSGIAQFLTKLDLGTLKKWMTTGYEHIQKLDKIYSDWFCIPHSIKTTSIKPSGTVSLLAGATPGMHYPESRFYIRRMRIAINSPLVLGLKDAGYPMEPAVGAEKDTLVVEIPVDVGEGIRTVSQVSMWEQVALSAFIQRNWADNQVSCTVTFDPKMVTSEDISNCLNYFQWDLKGISFLPKCDFGAFPQMPYEEITEEEFTKRNQALKEIKFFSAQQPLKNDGEGEMFCDGDTCVRA